MRPLVKPLLCVWTERWERSCSTKTNQYYFLTSVSCPTKGLLCSVCLCLSFKGTYLLHRFIAITHSIIKFIKCVFVHVTLNLMIFFYQPSLCYAAEVFICGYIHTALKRRLPIRIQNSHVHMYLRRLVRSF